MNPTPGRLLPTDWQVPDDVRDRIGDEAGRQRLLAADGHLVLVLHSPPRQGEDHRVGRFFWRDRDGRWRPAGLKHGSHAIGELLDEYEALANEIDSLEDSAASAADYFAILSSVHPLIRSANNLLGVLEEARNQVPKDRSLILLRDRAYALSRRLDLMQHEAKTNIDYSVAQRAEEQALAAHHQMRAAYRLNVLAAFFFPMTTMGAVFGMNLSNGLEGWDTASGPAPIAALVGLALAAGVGLALLVARR